MAWTQNDLAVLEKAIAQGAMRVKYADKEVEYRSLEEMFTIREQMKEELGITEKNSGRRYASFDKGIK